jgi:hypothetical protein
MMSDEDGAPAASPQKVPRFRSPPYPYIPLGKAIERVEALYAKALHHPVPVTVAAEAWGYGAKSSGLFATIAALKQFGLLLDDGSGDKRRFKVSDGGIRIVRDPDPGSEKRRDAIRHAALSPRIHRELWDLYGVAGVSGAMDVAIKSYLTLDRADNGAAPYGDKAADELVEEYKQTITYAGLTDSLGVSSDIDEVEDNTNLDDRQVERKMAGHVQHDIVRPPPNPSDEDLNDIKAELSGGKVRISAWMDIEGLEELEEKITAFKTLLKSKPK